MAKGGGAGGRNATVPTAEKVPTGQAIVRLQRMSPEQIQDLANTLDEFQNRRLERPDIDRLIGIGLVQPNRAQLTELGQQIWRARGAGAGWMRDLQAWMARRRPGA